MPSHPYLALRLSPQTDEVALVANDAEEGERVLDTAPYTFVTETWEDFEINWDVDGEAVEVQIGGTVLMTVSVADIQGLDNRTGFFGQGTDDGIFVDELHVDGDAFEEEVTIEPPEVDPEVARWPLVKINDQMNHRVRYLDFNHAGDRLVAACNGGESIVYHVGGTWGLFRSMGHPSDANHVAHSTDDSWLAMCLGDGSLEVRDASDYGHEYTIPDSDFLGIPTAVHFHPDGDEMAVGTNRGYVYLFDITASDPADWDVTGVIQLDAEEGTIRDIRYSPDGSYLGYGTSDMGLKVFEHGSYTTAVFTFSTGDNLRVLDWSPDSRFLTFGGGTSQQLWVRDVADNFSGVTIIQDATNNVWYNRYSGDSKYIGYGEHDTGLVRINDTHPDYDLRVTLTDARDNSANTFETVESLAFHPDGLHLAYGSRHTPAVYIHDTPIRGTTTMTSGAQYEAAIRRASVRGEVVFQTGTQLTAEPTVTGPPAWHITMDHGTVIADGIEPSITTTVTPGDIMDLTVVFDNPFRFREHYREFVKYTGVAQASSVRHGMTDVSRPWFRERIAHEEIDSLLIRVVPGAGIHEDFKGFWGLVVDMTDMSHSFTDKRVVETSVLILSEDTEYTTAEEVRDALQAPIFGDDPV